MHDSEIATTDVFPALDEASFATVDRVRLLTPEMAAHPPRILLLYGSLRPRSFSRLAAEEAGRILIRLGAEVRFFNPSGLPLPDQPGADMAKVEELRSLVTWSEGMVWSSPERHGAMTGIMKAQIDWIPLSIGAVRPTQGKTLAVMPALQAFEINPVSSSPKAMARYRDLCVIAISSRAPVTT